MNSLFVSQLALSFVVGSVWVLMTTLAADRFGSRIGGIIGGFPSTAAVSFFFIGLTQTPETAAQATTVFPLSYSFTGLFLVLFALFWRKGFFTAMAMSMSAWFVLSACVVVLDLENFFISVVFYAVFFTAAVYVLEVRLKLVSVGRGEIKSSTLQLLSRALFGGGIVAFTVFISRIGGPVLGGIFSAFPAIFISILILSYQSRGISFSRAMTKPLLVTGMVSIFMYALGVRIFYPIWGIGWGTLAAYGFSACGALASSIFIKTQLS